MTIAALLIGLAVGAAGAFVFLREALVERRTQSRRVVELEKELAAATARLDASERSFDRGRANRLGGRLP
jgi:uncharacterized membrane protein YccC